MRRQRRRRHLRELRLDVREHQQLAKLWGKIWSDEMFDVRRRALSLVNLTFIILLYTYPGRERSNSAAP